MTVLLLANPRDQCDRVESGHSGEKNMKRWIAAAAGLLGLSILTLVGVVAYVNIGRSRGEQWSSLDGPEAVWPAVVGFTALWAIPISAIVLLGLVLAAIVRAYRPRAGSKKSA
ncbi:hypothetical protein K2F54_18725 [Cryobacterium sp. 1639]|uniref:hypothetical protein n=1 Tax=Cryobacterium inferilacus TaxID=2866629 RepID=UPI001C731BD2|nr:hypothetical protein [Cryobacterium sp. 1639]MBX0302000.1 hypothetical protein [Cryobacterium sp. 1639]